jgi:hypothetical protein
MFARAAVSAAGAHAMLAMDSAERVLQMFDAM